LRVGRVYSSFKTRDGRVAVLRTLRRSDLPSLVRFVNGFVKEKRTNRTLGVTFGKRATLKSEAKWLKRMLDGIKRGDVINVAAELDGEIVGNSEIARRTFSGEVKHTGVLGIAIVDGYRGLGLGGRMLRVLLDEARRAGVRVVELEVFSVNTGARRLYERLGFRRVGVVPKKILRRGRYLDTMTMYADLSDKSTASARGNR